jgi:MFS family permease
MALMELGEVIDREPAALATARLWTRNFTLYFGARVVSLLGDAMMPVAVALAVGPVYGVSGVGFVLSVWTTPFVIFVLFGGVFADRIGARAMMVGADLVRVGTQTGVAIAFFTGTPPMWFLLSVAMISGTAAAMFQPGVNGMVPLVSADPQRANGTLKVADATCQLASPALAGLLVTLAGAGTVFTVDASTFLISAGCLALIRLAPRDNARQPSTVRRDLRRGWQEFRSRTWMWSVIIVWVVFGILLFGPYIPVGSRLISERLGAASYGWVMAGLGAGTIIGGLIAIRRHPTHPLKAGASVMLGFAFIPFSVALELPMPLLILCHLLGGGAVAFWSVMWSTSVQTQVGSDVLNRVTAYEVSGSVSGLAVGQALAGPISTVIHPRDLLLISTIVCLTGCVTFLLIRPVRTLRRIG